MIHWCFLLFRKRVCFQVSKPLVFVGGIEKKNLVSKKNQELEEKKLNSWRCWYFKYHGVCPLFFVPEKSRRTMKKYMACNFQLHGFCKKKTWRNSYGEFGISLINQTSGKKKRNSKVDPLPPKRVFSAGNAAVTWFSCLFFASGIWSTQTSFLSYRRLYGLLANKRVRTTTVRCLSQVEGSSIPRVAAFLFPLALVPGSLQVDQAIPKMLRWYIFHQQKTSGRKRKKITDIWVNFNFKCQMFRVYDHLCDIIVVIMPGN